MKSELPVPCYYESEFPNSIKMDLINGISMYDRLLDVGKDIVMEEMMIWFEKMRFLLLIGQMQKMVRQYGTMHEPM